MLGIKTHFEFMQRRSVHPFHILTSGRNGFLFYQANRARVILIITQETTHSRVLDLFGQGNTRSLRASGLILPLTKSRNEPLLLHSVDILHNPSPLPNPLILLDFRVMWIIISTLEVRFSHWLLRLN